MNHINRLSNSEPRPSLRFTLSITVLWLTACLPFSVNAAVPHTVIALSESAASGFPEGVVFEEFSAPILNNAGVVSFGAFVPQDVARIDNSNNFGYWLGAGNGLQLGFRTGAAVPGLPSGSTYGVDALFAHTVDDFGRISFAWRVQGGVNSGSGGVWTGTPGNLNILAQDGAVAPALPSATPSHKFDLTPVAVYQTNGGTILFGAADNGSDEFPSVLWRGEAGSLNVVARSYGPVPNQGANIVFDRLSKVAVSPGGHVAFHANMLDVAGSGTVTVDNDAGLWSGGVGTLALIVREGTNAPGTAGKFRIFEQPGVNHAGRIAFRATLSTDSGINSSNDDGIWKEVVGGTELVAREGSAAPGTGEAVFDVFSDPCVGAAERVSFGAKLLAGVGGVDQGNDTGLWGSLSGTLSLVAREGSQAPGLPAGVLFENIAFANSWTANESGALAFLVDLAGTGVSTLNDRSLWAQQFDGSLALVAREGDLFAVAPNDLRRIAGIDFATGADLRASSLADGWNDNFQLAFHLEFDDGTEGLFLANVPEPGSAAILAVGALMLGVRRMRSRGRAVL